MTAAGATLPSQRPPDQKTTLATSHPVALPAPQTPPAQRPSPAPARVSWPPAVSTTVTVPAAGRVAGTMAAGSAAGGAYAAGTPITLYSSGRPARATVGLASRTASANAGVNGVVFSVAGISDGRVSVDYSAFAHAGSNYASRLHLVALPACALTTPQAAPCREQTPLTSTNDTAAQTLTAALPTTLAGDGGVSVLGVVAGASGSNGDFRVSSLAPSGSWTVSGGSGGMGWSYPLTVPPAATGSDVAPTVSLSYNSAAVDGQVTTTNNQSSWLGEGWDYQPGYIERTYRTCADDPNATTDSKTGDLCWAGQVVTMNLGGATTALVLDDATHTWHVQNDNGQRVELVNAPTSGGYQGEYWKITTTAGVQYFFGRNQGPGWASGNPTTNSVFTEPVYGAHAGDPCYTATSFSASSCTQAWRWNLDFVEDPHGNTTAYYYTRETNNYGADGQTTAVPYIRGGYLSRIDYGLRDENGTIYTQPAPQQVKFTVSERCITTTGTGGFDCGLATNYTTANASHWPDTPVDQSCAATPCTNYSPTFFTRKRLTSITTQYYNGSGYTKVDTYALGQSFPTSDTAGDQELELDSITRTGYTSTGSSIKLPAVAFTYTALDNRVANYSGLPSMAHFRLTGITAETGEHTAITYSAKQCTATSVPDPANLAGNTMRCFPVYWTQPGQTSPSLDFFHKYLVTRVATSDGLGLSPGRQSNYTYLGNPAWHLDDNELVKPAYRTYGQFRGYAQVEVRTGNTGNSSNGVADKQTLVRTGYLRGIGGNVTDTLGDTLADPDEDAGLAFEVQTFNGSGGAQLSTTINRYHTLATTASRARPGGTPALSPLVATMTVTTDSRVVTTLAAGGTTTKTSAYTYDNTGRLIQQNDSGTGIATLCTVTSYADNTTSWIRDHIAETITGNQTCPAVGTALTTPMSDTRTFYDGSTTLGQLTGTGNATQTLVETTTGAWAKTTVAYDAAGRITTTKVFTSTTDTTGRTSTTAYTPTDGGPLTKIYTTNPVGQHTTTNTDPGRGVTTSNIDIAGHRTDATYDALGRLTAVWRPGQVKGTNSATETYSYLLRSTGPSAVTTKTYVDIGPSHSYVKSISLYNQFGDVIQTQTDAEGAAGNRLVTDTTYDSHGWVVDTNSPWYTTGTPATTAVATTASQIPQSFRITYDGAGRQTLSAEVHNGTAVSGDTTTTAYGGDRTTVVPPTGGTTQTTLTDVRGNTTAIWQYSAAPTISGSVVTGGTHRNTTYTYDALGRQSGMTDPGGAHWATTYDLAGRITKQLDPDTGTTTTVYNDAGDITSTTDARGTTLTYTYDKLSRKTGEYHGTTHLAGWVYDTLQAGRLTSSTRYTTAGNYVVATVGYDAYGNSTGTKTTIPTAAGTGIAGTYTTNYTWTKTHLQSTETQSAAGSLAGEVLSKTYTRLGNPASTSGAAPYVATTTYSPYGEPTQMQLGTNNDTGWLTYTRNPSTHLLTGQNLTVQAASPQVENLTYTYNLVGEITQTKETQGNTSPVEHTCYTYNKLMQLTRAWTASSCTSPAKGSITGPQPYWTSWSINSSGDRTKQIQHGTTIGSTDATTTYTYTTTGHAHALTSTATSGSITATAAYTYSTTGSNLKRTTTGAGGGTQTFTYDAEGRPATLVTPAGTTKYLYDADGNLLIRTEPTVTVLVLPDNEQVTKTNTGTVLGFRWYTHAGITVAERVSALWYDSFTDIHGTNLVNIPNITGGFGTPIRRHQDAYGNPIGTPTGTWYDHNAYLGKPAETAAGLSDLGPRTYDPALGRFRQVDPILTPYDPGQNDGYSYGAHNPLFNTDPTGQHIGLCLDSCGSREDILNQTRFQQATWAAPATSAPQATGALLMPQPGQTVAQAPGAANNPSAPPGTPVQAVPTGASGAPAPPAPQGDALTGVGDLANFIWNLTPFPDAISCYHGHLFDCLLAAVSAVGVTKAASIAAKVAINTGKKVTTEGASSQLPELTMTRAQLEAKYKHAADFGVVDPRGAVGFDAYGKAVDAFVHDPSTIRVAGTYHKSPAILNYNPTSSLVIVQSPDGAFVSGWHMSPAQLQNVIERGSLGGG